MTDPAPLLAARVEDLNFWSLWSLSKRARVRTRGEMQDLGCKVWFSTDSRPSARGRCRWDANESDSVAGGHPMTAVLD